MLKVVTNLKFKPYGNCYIQNCHTFREKFGTHSSLPEPYLGKSGEITEEVQDQVFRGQKRKEFNNLLFILQSSSL